MLHNTVMRGHQSSGQAGYIFAGVLGVHRLGPSEIYNRGHRVNMLHTRASNCSEAGFRPWFRNAEVL